MRQRRHNTDKRGKKFKEVIIMCEINGYSYEEEFRVNRMS